MHSTLGERGHRRGAHGVARPAEALPRRDGDRSAAAREPDERRHGGRALCVVGTTSPVLLKQGGGFRRFDDGIYAPHDVFESIRGGRCRLFLTSKAGVF